MKFIYLIFFVFSFELYAQTLKGRVIEASTKQPIPFANISIVNSNNNLKSNELGYFQIEKIKVGRYSINVTSAGYKEVVINEILLSVGKDTELTIQLTENLQELDELIVKANKEYGLVQNDFATISSKSVSVEQTKRYAATWSDPARMALSFTGTSNVNDQTNEIVIRGNSPKGMLWRIEGVEVPNPSHFSTEGSTGGGLSALSINVLGNSDFYTGAFPAEFGNATSGVFDVRLRKGNSDKHETTLQAGFQGLEFGTEGPFTKKSKASYLVNYRYSTLGIMNKLGVSPVTNANPIFQDFTFKTVLPMKNTVLSLWGVGGLSRSKYNNDSFIEESKFLTIGLNSITYINKKAYWENILSLSGNAVLTSFENKNFFGLSDTKNLSYKNARLSSNYNLKINTKHQIKTGLIVTLLYYNLLNKVTYDSLPNIGYFVDSKLNERGKSDYYQGYFQWKYRMSQNLTINSGIHSSFFKLNNDYSIEPRFGASYQLTRRSNLNFGFGLHSRLEPISIYLSKVQFKEENGNTSILSNKALSIPRSQHIVLGYEFRPNRKSRINSEVYYQQHSKIGVAQYDFLFKNFSLINEIDVDLNLLPLLKSIGTGKNYGIELTVEKFLMDGFYLLNTTSLFRSTFTNIDGQSFTGRFSNDFVQNIIAGKEWKIGKEENNLISLNLRSTYAGGVRVMPINLEKSIIEGAEVRDPTGIYNQKQLADFFRTDLKINFIKNGKKSTSTLSLDLNNITNRKNPKRIYYDYSTKSVATIYQLGILPVFNYRLEF
jgi:hypothetical protein